jgi:DNA-binding NarL/FixJ family response regulator
MNSIRVLLADDHAMLRDGLKLLLASQNDFEVVGELGNLAELKAVVRRSQPDLLLIDYHMPGGDTAALIAHLKQTEPQMRIVVLTGSSSAVVLQQLTLGQADAVLLKDDSAAELLAYLRAIWRGERVVSARVQGLIGGSEPPALTAREMQVVKLVCDGLSGPAIAALLSLSPKTVDKHRENLMRKLAVNSSVQLVQKVRGLGWFGASSARLEPN